MLSAGAYLLGVAYLLAVVGAAALGAASLRRRLVPELKGAAAVLASIVLASALLVWTAELLGTLGLFEALPYLLLLGAIGIGLWGFSGGWRGVRRTEDRPWIDRRPPLPRERTRPPIPAIPTLIALAVAAVAAIHFADGVHLRLDTGMTGFDSTWYHGPFAAGFHQTGNTWDLHHIAPQFMAWFYPANAEIFHAIGFNAFARDLLSPLLNLGWFIGCLLACWAIGKPYRMGPAALALGAFALGIPALADQAGEARNDIVGVFFLLAAIAIVLAARPSGSGRGVGTGPLLVAGLAVGLAAGTKLNFLLPAAVLVIGLVVFAPPGRRGKAAAAGGLAALAGGGYWYLRNLVNAGNPLPWFDHLGPIALPGPSQDLGGREEHSVLSYLTDWNVWSDWFLPGLHDGLGVLWPLLVALAIAGLVLCLPRRAGPVLRVTGAVGFAALVAWLVAPTSASGPEGMPRGFESGLRYLAPALVLGLAVLPATPAVRSRLARIRLPSARLRRHGGRDRAPGRIGWSRSVAVGSATLVLALAIAVGYVVQRDYLRDRYANPGFTTPGLNAAFKWATPLSGVRIATTATRQYPLYGTELDNEVEFVGEDRPHGGFVAPASCRAWRRLIDAGDYDYVVASRDRVEPGRTAYPRSARWTESPNAKVILKTPPTVVFELLGPLDPSRCRN